MARSRFLRLPPLEALATQFAGALSHGARGLTAEERADARAVFGDTIDLDSISVVRASIANAPTTLGNTIRIGIEGELDRITLIHELAHVWQYQTQGTAYISDSAWHQVGALLATGSRRAAYHLTEDDLSARSIHDLSAEKQAVVIECWFANPALREDPDYARFLAEVRSARKSS